MSRERLDSVLKSVSQGVPYESGILAYYIM